GESRAHPGSAVGAGGGAMTNGGRPFRAGQRRQTMTRIVLAAGSSLAVLAMLTACGDRGETPAAETPPAEAVEEAQAETPAPADIGLPGASASPAERNLAEAEAFLDRNSQRPEVTLTTSGLQYEVIESGPAAAPSPDEDDWAC